jgi:hypothetical protein
MESEELKKKEEILDEENLKELEQTELSGGKSSNSNASVDLEAACNVDQCNCGK